MESDEGKSAIEVPGLPLNVSAAYTGRIAIAYQSGKSFTRQNTADPTLRYVNLCIAIYECESSGGSEWILEDTINLKNIELQREVPNMDMSAYDQSKQDRLQRFAKNLYQSTKPHGETRSPSFHIISWQGLVKERFFFGCRHVLSSEPGYTRRSKKVHQRDGECANIDDSQANCHAQLDVKRGWKPYFDSHCWEQGMTWRNYLSLVC